MQKLNSNRSSSRKNLLPKWVLFCTFLFSLFAFHLNAQTVRDYADRLQKFGTSLPQEEVFIHMDNSSYFLGDTIYYKAYVLTSDGKLSNLSGLLYVELLNQDGYLVERQKLKLKDGQAVGSVELLDTLYGGYYELRAYTRWQLNWGRFEHPHTKESELWFYSKRMAKEYYRDYEKLYSRVFPVFDKPKSPGDYVEDMTLRPLRRYFKDDVNKPELKVGIYPEGGHLIDGVPCRVAFDALDEVGAHVEGTFTVTDNDGNVVATASTVNRGRGMVTFTPNGKMRYQFQEIDNSGSSRPNRKGKGKLEPETDGCALQATVEADGIHLTLRNKGTAAREQLGLTAMCHGMMHDFQELTPGAEATAVVPLAKVPTGVIQLSVFNGEGRIYADRLIFVRQDDFQPQTVTFTGISSQAYPAFGPITMGVHGQPGSTLSLAVRDASHSEYLFDSGSILTEMLLSSQIKGFVEAPEYYFESNDEEHQRALDLLLMVQGWRRYDWVEMATPKAFTLNYMPEKTETLTGEVCRYETEQMEDIFSNIAQIGMDEAGMSADYDEFANGQYSEYASTEMVRKWRGAKPAMFAAKILKHELQVEAGKYETTTVDPNDNYIELRMLQSFATEADAKRDNAGIQRTTGVDAASRFNESEGSLKREVRVHAEFVKPSANNGKGDAVVGDMATRNKGSFQISAPSFYESLVFFLGASDTTKWKKSMKQYEWIVSGEDKRMRADYPEFYVRISPIYPRFVKPYVTYQTQMRELPKGTSINRLDAGVRNLDEVTVHARRNGLNGFDASKPAFVLDAYQAFNDVCDAGFCPGYYIGSGRFVIDVARTYIGDMNMERNYDLEPRYNSHNLSFNMTPGMLEKYNHLPSLDKVYVYTDYSPRREGDKKFDQDNQPMVTVDLHRYEDDSQRITYRDRRYILSGYNVCEEFYQPDYTQKPLPAKKDYRRTLYWNPDLKLDANGNADLRFFNNGKSTQITVSAEGLGPNGSLQTGISYPETR